MESWIFWTTLILFGTLAQECTGKTHFKFMTNYCSETVEVAASLQLVLAPTEVLKADRSPDYFHCSVNLLAAKGRRLHVYFLHLSISSDTKHTDRLKLYDMVEGRPRIPITPAQGVYGMLDRSMLTSDQPGGNVGEFTSQGRTMQVEYLGKPTQTHSGFRLLVTTISDKDSRSGKCPHSMFDCPDQPWCIPSMLLCDGLPNCGEHDAGDETGCNVFNMASSVSYSLTQDVLLICVLPVSLFILAVVLVALTTRWHVNKMYPPILPTVKYTHQGDGDVDFEGVSTNTTPGKRVGAPPSYTEAVISAQFTNKPPSYNMLEELERKGFIMDSDDEEHNLHQYNRRQKDHLNHDDAEHHYQIHQQRRPNERYSPMTYTFQNRRKGDILTTSSSSIENVDDDKSYSERQPSSRHSHHHQYHYHQQQQQQQRQRRGVPKNDLDFSFSEDEETKQKTRRKGGKCKSKFKRRADDLCSPDVPQADTNATTQHSLINSNPLTSLNQQEPSTPFSVPLCLPDSSSSSQITSPLASPSSTNSNTSVPLSSSSSPSPEKSNKHTAASTLTAISSFTSIALRHQNHSPNIIIHTNGNSNNNTSADGRSPAVLPLSSSSSNNAEIQDPPRTQTAETPYLYQKEAVLHSSDLSMSSGPEADKNIPSETESGVLDFTEKTHGKTESCASSSNSHDGGDVIVKGGKRKDKNRKRVNGKGCKKRGVTKTNNEGGRVIFELSTFDSKVNGVDDDDGGDDGVNDDGGCRKDLHEDADVSSDGDNGEEVDNRKQQVATVKSKKKLTQA